MRVLWKALVTSMIPMVMWYVSAMETIIRSVGDASTGEEYWSNSMPFTWGPQLTQWHWQQWQILSLIFLVDGAKTDQGMRIVMGRL